MPSFHMLLADDTINVGDTVPNVSNGQPNPVVADPRTMPITDALDNRTQDGLVHILRSNSPTVRVARVEPQGDVRPHSDIWDTDFAADDSTELEADGGWRVSSIEPLHTILGPQGELIVAAVQHGISAFEDENPHMAPLAKAYHAEVERLYVVPDDRHHVVRARTAAVMALGDVGVDTYWWGGALGYEWGSEIIALAARDLIGTRRGWTWDAYDLLTRPWRTAFSHQLHPQDTQLHLSTT